MFFRLYFLCTNTDYAQAAENQSNYAITVAKTRAMIYDRNFEPLVNEKVTYKAIVLPTAAAMAEITELLPIDKRTAILNKFSEGKPFLIDLGDDFDKNKKYENIDIFSVKSRYSQEGTAKHVIGYLSGDNQNGISGIEKAYNDFMQSQGGVFKVRYSVDAVGNVLVGAVAEVEELLHLRVSPAGLPAGHRLPGDVQLLRELLLGEPRRPADLLQPFSKGHGPLLLSSRLYGSPFWPL